MYNQYHSCIYFGLVILKLTKKQLKSTYDASSRSGNANKFKNWIRTKKMTLTFVTMILRTRLWFEIFYLKTPFRYIDSTNRKHKTKDFAIDSLDTGC